MAGLLHDVVEDTGTSEDVVREEFGAEVAQLVAAVTKPDASSVELVSTDAAERKVELWRKQHQAMLDALVRVTDPRTLSNILRLKAADSLANLRAIRRDLANPAVGESVWQRFKTGRPGSLWYYQQILEHMGPIADEPLVRELGAALEGVRGMAPPPVAPLRRP